MKWHEIGQVENAENAGWTRAVSWPLDLEEDRYQGDAEEDARKHTASSYRPSTYIFGTALTWNNSHEAIARNLTLIARMHKVDELTGQMLLKYWGGGFEMIYRDTGNGLVYLKDYTILFWTLDLEDRDSEIRPEGFIKYERREGFSVLTSHRRGVFAMKAIPTSVFRGVA